MKLKTILIAILVILFVVIFLQNTQMVTLQFFFWKVAVSRIILIPLFVIIGFVLGYVVAKIEKKHS